METTAKKLNVGIIVAAVVALAGVAVWIYQLSNGLGITGMSNGNSWGLYITCFMFFVGLSAGGLIVASSASVFHIAEYKKVALPAVIVSAAAIVVAAMFVLVDLGGIQRVWMLLTSPNFASPLLWDVIIITVYLVIDILYLVFLSKGDDRKVTILGRVALPVAILVHSVTAWIFGLQIAKEGWYTAILAPIFVASALDSGMALLLCALAWLRKKGIFDVEQKLFSNLAGLLCVFIAVDAFFIGCEVLTMAYPGASGAEALAIMTSGATAPFFWIEVVCGLLVPFCMLVFAKNRAKTGVVVAASVLVIIGVFCKRAWLLLTSFVNFNLDGPVTLGTQAAQAGGSAMWATAGSYAPTLPEVGIALGVVAVGFALFLILSKKLLVK
ncbi:MAG: polysulfide reductase NrfD [Eggerthellaceae bacterium]|nr:polysulfide reductase NrfD [Eggerthellaceae bacterium]